jgi:hypothetical protein
LGGWWFKSNLGKKLAILSLTSKTGMVTNAYNLSYSGAKVGQPGQNHEVISQKIVKAKILEAWLK